MAQTGFTPIQIYHSATAAAVPLAADLLQGELAINVADGKLYYKNSSNVVQLLVAAGTGGGTVTSITGSGGTTGLTLSGGPITSVGTLTIGGTLAIANGGTGQTTANAALNALLPVQTSNAGKVLSTDGVNTSWITVSGGGGGTVTGVTAVFPATSTGGTAPVIGVAHGSGACTTTTGTGALVFGTSPTLVTPVLGTPVSGNFSTGTFTWPTFNQNTTGTAAGLSATLVATNGGTGQSSYAIGDLLYASTSTALSKLADVATGNALISGGVGVAPSWGKIGLTTHVSGTLPIANGGTGSTTKNFVDLTTTQTIGGAKTFTSNVVRDSGASSYSALLSNAIGLGNSGSGVSSDGSTSIGFFIQGAGSVATMTSAGDFTITGANATKASGTTWINPSDERLKNNIQNYSSGLSKLMQVQPKTWEYNGKGDTTAGTKGIGVVADEIESVLPNTVDTYKAKLNKDDTTETDIKRFDATEITWLLVNSVKELKAELDAAKAEIETLKAK